MSQKWFAFLSDTCIIKIEKVYMGFVSSPGNGKITMGALFVPISIRELRQYFNRRDVQ